MTPKPAQFRAARAWLSLTRKQVSRHAGLPEHVVGAMERGEAVGPQGGLVQALYEARGIAFRFGLFGAGDGIEFRKPL